MTTQDVVPVIAFQEGDIEILTQKGVSDDYLTFAPTPEQFTLFEEYCSGSRFCGNFAIATEWAIAHFKALDAEAREWLEDEGDHPEAGRYHLPMGYCLFGATQQLVIYETTSGTILAVTKDGSCAIQIPRSRAEGFHHTLALHVLAGWTKEQIDRWVNPHLYVEKPRSTKPEPGPFDNEQDGWDDEDFDCDCD